MKSAVCLVAGKIVWITLKRKTARYSAGKRNVFRKRNTNLLSAFHLFSGLAWLPFSFNWSPFEFRLNTFGLPSRSIMCPEPSLATARLIPLNEKRIGCILLGSITPPAPHTKLISFWRRNINHSARSRNRLRSQSIFASQALRSRLAWERPKADRSI